LSKTPVTDPIPNAARCMPRAVRGKNYFLRVLQS